MNLGDLSSQLKGLSIQPGSVFKMTLFPKDGVTPKNEGDVSRTKCKPPVTHVLETRA